MMMPKNFPPHEKELLPVCHKKVKKWRNKC